MSSDQTHDGLPSRQPRFDTTRWSLVLAAAAQSSDSGRDALAELCERYWYPLYAYVRRRFSDVHEAQDLTQAFFAQLLEKQFVAQADPARGRFRTFLLAALSHFLSNEWHKGRAQKRGGGKPPISLDLEQAEDRFSKLPADDLTAERLFERQWALALLQEVLERLRRESMQAGAGKQFEKLAPTLTLNRPDESYAEIAESLKMSPNAVKVAVHRLRKRYREMLRAEIAQTLSDPSSVDDEIQRMFDTFA